MPVITSPLGLPISGFLPTISWAMNTAVKLTSPKHGWSHQQLAEKSPVTTNPWFRTLSTALACSCLNSDRPRAQSPPSLPPHPKPGSKKHHFLGFVSGHDHGSLLTLWFLLKKKKARKGKLSPDNTWTVNHAADH